ncbi:hypothetical protein PQ796_03265 (plasmid) [Priestia megaterium]|uniref:hypothetical protein n=1 Tax=Priestia megaterium TaxID=1404 RepID=UPI00244C68B0|nr:hypothetical protein [Priestia megaterium]MDH2449571.1 hypothetical protein [Priestia megaterium]MDL5149029.1 hypothetical protein [Priestia megaterium]
MMKQRRKISFDTETDRYIQNYMEEHHLRFPADAISQICKEHKEAQEAQKRDDDSIQRMVKSVTQNIDSLLERERRHIRNALCCAEKSIQRSTMKNFKEVEDYRIAKTGKLMATIVEGYKK